MPKTPERETYRSYYLGDLWSYFTDSLEKHNQVTNEEAHHVAKELLLRLSKEAGNGPHDHEGMAACPTLELECRDGYVIEFGATKSNGGDIWMYYLKP